MGIAERYRAVAAEVAEECRRCGRDPSEVRLIAVSKTVGVEGAAEAFEAGAADFGENRPDQLMEKADALPAARWHFIGNIQGRRIRDIVGRAALIHSVHDIDHASKISRCAQERGMVQEILIEVNVSGEESKSGAVPAEVAGLVARCLELPGLEVRGLMTMAPQGDPAAARETFVGLKNLLDEVAAGLDPQAAAAFNELSMGMSEDWKEAISAGATMVRIGRAVFSDSFEEV